MKFWVVFKTMNLISGRVFYSMHKTDDLFFGTPDYTDDCIGGNQELLQDLKKLGRNNFYVEAIQAYTDQESAQKMLDRFLTQEVYDSPNYYNKELKGISGYTYIMSDEHKQSLREAKTGIPRPESVKQQISETKSGKTWINNGEVDRVHEPGDPVPEGWKLGRVFRKRNRKSKQDNNLEE